MTKKEIALLSFKVLAVYAFLRAVDRSYYIANYLLRKNELNERTRTSLGLDIIPSLLCALCGMVLWFIAPTLAASIFKTTPSEEEPPASPVAMQEIAFSVVGLVVLAMAFPDIVSTIATIVMSWPGQAIVYSIVLLLAKIVLGFWLLLGSHGLVKLVRSTRRS